MVEAGKKGARIKRGTQRAIRFQKILFSV
jgi:hypothetical protein